MVARMMITIVLLSGAVRLASAQDVALNGTAYRETRHVERTPVVKNGWTRHTRTEYRNQTVTELRNVDQTMYTPVTEYHCEPRWENWWNPLAPPCISYHVRPSVRWTTHVRKVQVPVTYRQMVPETRVVQVPVRKLGWAEREVEARVAVTAPPPPQVSRSPAGQANRIGGIARLGGDPPRHAMPAQSLGTIRR